ncbi:hypothetical protein KUTeg_011034 [Tegillarca granosa]|uniref:Tight junction protein ZO-1 n=1 Tax=Tegillarca granosa TaxID=220873 RepID=A0ABQ9F2P4_TEGGR|nr:hypothetical protein KUTeg_011034 [Tegillarca granosa]
MKDSGNTVNLVIRRRVVLPPIVENEMPPYKITLTKKSRKDDYGVILGCKFFIQEILGNSLAAQDGGIKEGDLVLKLNNTPLDNLSLIDARKLIEKSKDRLQLLIMKKKYEDVYRRQGGPRSQDDEYSLGYGTLQGTLQSKRADTDDINIYRPVGSPEKGLYDRHDVPQGAYPSSSHVTYDGHYIYDHEAPPRPPLPPGVEDAPPRPPSPGKELLRPDDFYSPHSPKPDRDGYMSDSGRRHDYIDQGMARKPQERYVGKRKDIVLDPRSVYFEKEPEVGLGLRLAGGNATGIFIASVQQGSGADAVGLTEGDQILKANNVDIPGLTREEAVTYLTSLEGRVSMVVQYKKEEYDRIMASHEAGDSFYIRTHFSYEQKQQGELSFASGDIFRIKDTLFRGVVGSWLAIRIGRNNQETQKGIIPNKNRAFDFFNAQQSSESEKENSPLKSRGSLFKRKSARRSKSLGKDHWEDVIFCNYTASLQTKFPPYEQVILKETMFLRPVVIFGALSDVARDKLLRDYPDRFESPQNDGFDDEKKNKSGIIRLGAIRDIISKRKHCLLDVTPHNVDKLNYAQYYPIVVFLKAENKNVVKESRTRYAKGSSKNPKKLYEQSVKLEKMYQHLFTATISHNSSDIWYRRLLEMIDIQQNQPIWMSERKPDEDINDDYLFPMASRLSIAASRESDVDLSRPLDDFHLSPTNKKRMVRSSSDPSINTTEKIPGIPPYPAPPSYHHHTKSPSPQNPGMLDDRRYVDHARPEDRYYPSYYADSLQRSQYPRSNIDPYATITPHERIRQQLPDDDRWFDPAYDGRGQPRQDRFQDYHRSEPDLGRHDPHHHHPSTSPLPPPQHHQPPEHQHHPEHRPYDSSSYSGDSYSKYASNPVNRHDDSKLREKKRSIGNMPNSSHDPYRFTRSTANPVSTANIDKSKLSDLSARYRRDDQMRRTGQNIRSPSSPHSPLDPQENGPVRPKKEPPPVPIKTYNLKDRGIEPDDQKIRNYENSNRDYNYSEASNYAIVNHKPDRFQHQQQPPPLAHEYIDQNENPYDFVAPRGNQRQSSSNIQYAQPFKRTAESNFDRGHNSGKSFTNQIYMDHQELEKLKAAQESGFHGNQDIYVRDSGYPSPSERPRTDDELQYMKQQSDTEDKSVLDKQSFSSYKKLITPGFYGSKSKVTSTGSQDEIREKNTPDQGQDDRNSAFESYRKPAAMSTFGKSDLDDSGIVKPIQAEPGRHFRLDDGRDEGQTVVATARGVFDHNGGVLESKETGVSIVIPEGALPEGVQQEIYFKVCRDNNILPPLDREKGETLLSPLVMCGPHGLKFLHPVELRLPHCASVNPDSWSFALKSSDSPTGHPTQWQNMSLAGMEGVAQGKVGKSSVSVLVDHF